MQDAGESIACGWTAFFGKVVMPFWVRETADRLPAPAVALSTKAKAKQRRDSLCLVPDHFFEWQDRRERSRGESGEGVSNQYMHGCLPTSAKDREQRKRKWLDEEVAADFELMHPPRNPVKVTR
jgi:hypothetical protein